VRLFGRGDDGSPVRITFMCVENAGRSQMAAALAERERDRRGLGDRVEVHSAGTHPVDAVHGVVVDAMSEVGIDLSDRVPRVVDLELLKRMDYVVTMGCHIAEFDPNSFGGDTREWDLPDPEDADVETARLLRDALDWRVSRLFEEIERESLDSPEA
jgi:protein-tyrosine-phosphatase